MVDPLDKWDKTVFGSRQNWAKKVLGDKGDWGRDVFFGKKLWVEKHPATSDEDFVWVVQEVGADPAVIPYYEMPVEEILDERDEDERPHM